MPNTETQLVLYSVEGRKITVSGDRLQRDITFCVYKTPTKTVTEETIGKEELELSFKISFEKLPFIGSFISAFLEKKGIGYHDRNL